MNNKKHISALGVFLGADKLEDGISPAEYEWRQRKGFMYLGVGFGGLKAGVYCLNCHSKVILLSDSEEPFPRENCPNDECYNFARGIDFWLTGQEWLQCSPVN